MAKWIARVIPALAGAGVTAASAFAFHPDNLEPPWGIAHGDLAATARSTAIPFLFGSGTGAQSPWEFVPGAYGSDRPGGWASIVFDLAGNLYWRTTGGNNKLTSVSPSGNFRFNVRNLAGTADYVLGSGWNSTSPLIGNHVRLYALGAGVGYIDGDPADPDPMNRPVLAAFRKDTGVVVWETFLPEHIKFPAGWSDNNQTTPVLYNGKIYVVGENDGTSANVYQIDSTTGAIEWGGVGSSIAWPVSGGRHGSVAFAPGVFGGFDGLFVQTDSGSGNDLQPEVIGIQIDHHATFGGATLVWGSDGGKAARGHPIYSEVNGRIYTHTWNNYGAELYSFDVLTGAVVGNQNAANNGHGFFDVGALGFDGASIIAGGFNGNVVHYTENGVTPGVTTNRVLPFTNDACAPNWFGEYRVLGQLLQDRLGSWMLVTGTNSRVNPDPNDPFCPTLGPGPYPEFTARAVILNVSRASDVASNRPIVEYDTGIDSQGGFTLQGGPLIGPDGKMYYFHGNTGNLVALEPIRAKGDANCDGVTNTDDIPAFIIAVVEGRAAWEAIYSCNFLAGNDYNNDNKVDGDDVAALVEWLLP